MDISEAKSQFPIFSKKINGKQLVYLDSSNSAQKPLSVLKSLDNFYKNEFSNIGRSIHTLSVNATYKFEETRMNMKKFINASSKDEIIFTKNATESINLALKGLLGYHLKDGDHIITSNIEHKVAVDVLNHLTKYNVKISYVPVGSNGIIDVNKIKKLIS